MDPDPSTCSGQAFVRMTGCGGGSYGLTAPPGDPARLVQVVLNKYHPPPAGSIQIYSFGSIGGGRPFGANRKPTWLSSIPPIERMTESFATSIKWPPSALKSR